MGQKRGRAADTFEIWGTIMGSKLLRILKKNLLAILTISISVGVLLYFLFTTDGITSLAHIASSARPEWLLVTLGAMVGGWLLETYVLDVLCKHLYPKWRFFQSFHVAMTGLLYSALTPFATGGQPMQMYSMNKMGMDTGKAGSIVAMKTLVYQAIMVVYAMVMVILRLGYFQRNVSNFSFVTVIGLVTNGAFILGITLFMLSKKSTDRFLRFALRTLYRFHLCRHPVARYKRIHGQMAMFHDSAKTMGTSLSVYLRAGFFTVVQITLAGLIPYFIYRSFNLPVNADATVLTMLAAQIFVTMVSAFIPLPGSSGGAEGSFYLFFGAFFGPTIIPAILLWRLVTYYANILFGCLTNVLGRAAGMERK